MLILLLLLLLLLLIFEYMEGVEANDRDEEECGEFSVNTLIK